MSDVSVECCQTLLNTERGVEVLLIKVYHTKKHGGKMPRRDHLEIKTYY